MDQNENFYEALLEDTDQLGEGFVLGKKVTFSVREDMAVFEGDIILGTPEELTSPQEIKEPLTLSKGIEIKPVSETATLNLYLWPGGIIPYEISQELLIHYKIKDAIQHWERKTSLRFIHRRTQNAEEYPNFVSFQKGKSCSSPVGMRGGKQVISLHPKSSTGNIIHEIGHSIGLWHEQSRSDRDQHIDILAANIDPIYLHNFTQHIKDGRDLGNYDYGSIMHYPQMAFSRNGETTIRPKQGKIIGQRQGLSSGDIEAVRSIYEEEIQSGTA